ncbi:hypothetical protein Sango_2098500 [Sesamum angolense]|uniref:Endonuclease/exonuclease/phosphatase domain-containing protein n=1 Tax=Sesamum angolense TaxID=2727404 RepID=A0AAE1WBI2_9LAMI|nr:hypothetical protein Sango_2098500 [Sesamum angolense]
MRLSLSLCLSLSLSLSLYSHEEAVDGGTEKDMPISQSPPNVCQGIADVATCPLKPAVPEEPLPQDDSPVCVEPHPDTEVVALCPSGESILQSDTEEVTKCLARHQRGRSFGDEPEAHSASPDRGKVVSPRLRIVTRSAARIFGGGIELWESDLVLLGAGCDVSVERRALWDALRAASVGASPWIVGGDFNTVLSPDERSGGSAPSGNAMSDFHDAIADYALIDVGYVGSPYTWYSRRLCQRLDRVLISSCWMIAFPKMQVTHLELSQSDHRGLLVEAECTVERKVSSFHFQHMWTTHSEFLGVVSRNWQYPTVGSELNQCSAELVRVLAQDEAFWRQKAGIRWAKDGERNTRYFHSLVQKRRFRGTIFVIQHEGEYLTDPIAIKDSAAYFFQRLLTATPIFQEEMDSEHLEDGLTDKDRRSLCVMPTLEEVREAVFSIDPDRLRTRMGLGQYFFILVGRSFPRMFSAQ